MKQALYQAIFTDIDGTLLNQQHEISPRTQAAVKAVHHGQDVPFVLVSARPPLAITPFMQQLECRSPFVCFNGALILSASQETLFEIKLGAENFAAVEAALAAQTAPLSINYYEGLQWYSNAPEGYWSAQEGEITGLRATAKPADLHDAHKILVMAEADIIASLEAQLSAQFPQLSIKLSKTTYLEIVHQTALKSAAIAFLAQSWGIAPEKTLAFGDNFNDLDMLEYAGCGVAMGNAPEAIKQLADEVTLSNQEDGLAAVLERVFLS